MKKSIKIRTIIFLFVFIAKFSLAQDTIKYYRFTTAKYADVIIYNDSISKRVFYNFFGKKIESYTYLYDMLHGEAKGWYYTGQLKFVGNFKYGKRDGKWYYWYRNGMPKALEFYKEGGVQSVNYYVNDTLEGVATTYLPDGNKSHEYVYKKGEMIEDKWFVKGKIISDTKYDADTLSVKSNDKDSTNLILPFNKK